MRSILHRWIGDDPRSVFASAWDSAPFHRRAAPTLESCDLLAPTDLEELLLTRLLRYPDFRLIANGTVIPLSSYARKELDEFGAGSLIPDLDALWSWLDRGATLILQNVQRYWSPARELCSGIESLVGVPAPCTVFFTPRTSRGLDTHADPYEGLILHTAGTKTWIIYHRNDPTRVVLEAPLQAGDVLYVPRLYPHRAVTGDEPSIHLTFSLTAMTWRKFFAELLLFGGSPQTDLDALVPFDADRIDFSTTITSLRSWAASVQRSSILGHLAETSGATALPSGDLPPAGLFSAFKLSDATWLRWASTTSEVVVDGQHVSVRLPDRVLTMPSRVAPALEALRKRSSIRLGELAPLLDANSRMVLASRLLREGVLNQLSEQPIPAVPTSESGRRARHDQ
jgi:JmjC domain